MTLTDFINWGVSTYPAQNYALILWNHGGGWKESAGAIMGKNMYRANKAVCWDETSGNDCLFMSEVKQGLSQTSGVDLLGFDACLMGMTEVAYQIKDYVGVMIGAEEVEPWDGWPYNTILTDLVDNPTMTPAQFGQTVVNRYGEYYVSEPSTTQAAADLTKMVELGNSVSAFADTLTAYWDEIISCRAQTEEYYYSQNVDLYHFADLISKNVPDEAIQQAANNLKSSITSAVIANWSSSMHPNSNGLAIYFPETPEDFDESYNGSVIDFPAATTWDEFLKRFLNTPPTPPIINEMTEVSPDTPYTITWQASQDEDGVACYELQEANSSGVVFEDDIEGGQSGWTASGLWHISEHRSHSATHSWYYGQEGSWNYDTGSANSGSLTSPPIDLPPGVTLSFSYWLQTEDYGSPYDGAHIQLDDPF